MAGSGFSNEAPPITHNPEFESDISKFKTIVAAPSFNYSEAISFLANKSMLPADIKVTLLMEYISPHEVVTASLKDVFVPYLRLLSTLSNYDSDEESDEYVNSIAQTLSEYGRKNGFYQAVQLFTARNELSQSDKMMNFSIILTLLLDAIDELPLRTHKDPTNKTKIINNIIAYLANNDFSDAIAYFDYISDSVYTDDTKRGKLTKLSEDSDLNETDKWVIEIVLNKDIHEYIDASKNKKYSKAIAILSRATTLSADKKVRLLRDRMNPRKDIWDFSADDLESYIKLLSSLKKVIPAEDPALKSLIADFLTEMVARAQYRSTRASHHTSYIHQQRRIKRLITAISHELPYDYDQLRNNELRIYYHKDATRTREEENSEKILSIRDAVLMSIFDDEHLRTPKVIDINAVLSEFLDALHEDTGLGKLFAVKDDRPMKDRIFAKIIYILTYHLTDLSELSLIVKLRLQLLLYTDLLSEKPNFSLEQALNADMRRFTRAVNSNDYANAIEVLARSEEIYADKKIKLLQEYMPLHQMLNKPLENVLGPYVRLLSTLSIKLPVSVEKLLNGPSGNETHFVAVMTGKVPGSEVDYTDITARLLLLIENNLLSDKDYAFIAKSTFTVADEQVSTKTLVLNELLKQKTTAPFETLAKLLNAQNTMSGVGKLFYTQTGMLDSKLTSKHLGRISAEIESIGNALPLDICDRDKEQHGATLMRAVTTYGVHPVDREKIRQYFKAHEATPVNRKIKYHGPQDNDGYMNLNLFSCSPTPQPSAKAHPQPTLPPPPRF